MSILSFWKKVKEEAVLMDQEIARGLSLHDYNRTIKGSPRWGGAYTTAAYPFGRPITTVCTTSMESDVLPYLPDEPVSVAPPPPIKEWRCEGCGSVMLQEHRNCNECGKPRHFLYGEESKESVVKENIEWTGDSPFVILTSDGKTK